MKRRARAWVAALVGVLAAAGAAAAQTGPLRIGRLGEATRACAPVSATAPEGERAYAEHLSRRMGVAVQFCDFANATESGAALVAGGVDVTLVDHTLPQAARRTVRPILTTRAGGGAGRVLTTVSVLNNSPRRELSDLRGARVVFGGSTPYALQAPQAAMRDHGVDVSSFASQTVAASPDAALAALRSGAADVMVLYAAARQRLCRGNSPSEQPCADVRELWIGRPGVERAWAVRLDMPIETRLRFVGVHVALHLENPLAFGWLAPGAGELQPVEAHALLVAP